MGKSKSSLRYSLRLKPIGNLQKIADFLPPPGELAPQDEVAKITLTVDVDTIEFFKEMADNYGTKYQRMMREVLKGYAKKFSA